ncbi:MAG: hypothetical protein WBM31_07100, partial [Pseudolabrys sp.]
MKFPEFARIVIVSHTLIDFTVTAKQLTTFRLAQANSRLDQRIEHRLQIERRATDDLEHVGCGRLLLEGFTQLIQQARILDGDDGLGSKSRYQIDLLLGKRFNRIATQEHR